MPTIGFLEYARAARDAIDRLTDSGDAVLVSLQFDQRSSVRGFIDGALQFFDGSQLIFREFLDTTVNEPPLMYAYHYQDAAQQLVFRYDNAAQTECSPNRRTSTYAIRQLNLRPPPASAEVLDQILQILGSAQLITDSPIAYGGTLKSSPAKPTTDTLKTIGRRHSIYRCRRTALLPQHQRQIRLAQQLPDLANAAIPISRSYKQTPIVDS